MRIYDVKPEMRPQIVSLLQANHLPVDDLPVMLNNFFVAMDQGTVIGGIGMETHGQYGLLRSMVVHPDYRNKNIATTLVAWLEMKAIESGIVELYLLTETASGYFQKKGFDVIERSNVPAPVTQSSEFSHVCPVSAIIMKKSL